MSLDPDCVALIYSIVYTRIDSAGPTGGGVNQGLRLQVAEICVDALSEPAASNKVVEIVADQNEIVRSAAELFANVQ